MANTLEALALRSGSESAAEADPKRADEESLRTADIDLRAKAWLGAGLGVVAVSFFAARSESLGQALHVLGIGAATMLASGIAGFFLGFLFGIPRLAGGQAVPASNGQAGGAEGGEPHLAHQPNANLEQISDWLTKILVGVGLTQIRELPHAVKVVSLAIGRAIPFAHQTAASVLAGCLLVYFVCYGFLFGYLWTRIRVGPRLCRSDDELDRLRRETKEAVNKEQRAVEESRSARREAEREASKAEWAQTMEAMLEALYLPGGYDRAIRQAEAFLQAHGEPEARPENMMFWLRLACGRGQEAASARRADDAPKFAAARAAALAAARKALACERPDAIRWIRTLLHPAPDSGEDDLAVFRGDPEFEALVQLNG